MSTQNPKPPVIGLGEPIVYDPATSPAICPQRFTTGACRCCIEVDAERKRLRAAVRDLQLARKGAARVEGMLAEEHARAKHLLSLLDRALTGWFERLVALIGEAYVGPEDEDTIAEIRREAGLT